MCALFDLKMGRLLDMIDAWAIDSGQRVGRATTRLPPTRVEDSRRSASIRRREIKTIIWATGYRPDNSAFELPVLDAKVWSVTTAAWWICRACI